jgi:hypothetical protein
MRTWRGMAMGGALGLALTVSCGSSDDGGSDGTGSGGNGSGGSSSSGGSSAGSGVVEDWPTEQPPGPEGGGLTELTDAEVAALDSAACAGWSAEPEAMPATLMLLVDTSQSMDSDAPNSNQSKWSITAAALHDAIDSLPASVPVGLMFYPNRGLYQENGPQDIPACIDVSSLIPVAPNQQAALHDAVDAVNPAGCTPTHGAYQYALDNGLRVSDYPGTPYIVLITDGQPTLTIDCMGSCSPRDPVPTQPIIDAIAAAMAEDGTHTFVIGSPGSEQNETTGEDVRGWLSEAATAGGTATPGCSNSGPDFCHFDMSQALDFGEALRGALAEIAGSVISCSYGIPEPPPGETVDPNAVNLVIQPGAGGNVLLLRANGPSCQEGWYYDAEGNVALCQNSCDRAQSDNQASLRLFFGCQTYVEPPA